MKPGETDKYGRTELHFRAAEHAPHVASLLAHGARADLVNDAGLTPLELGVQSCSNTDLEDMVEIARLLLAHGAPKTPRLKSLLIELRMRVAKFRNRMGADFAARCDAAIRKLQAMLA